MGLIEMLGWERWCSVGAIRELLQYNAIAASRPGRVRRSPQFVQIEPTNRCNLDCLGCTRANAASDSRPRDLSVDELRHILGLLPDAEIVKLQGLGEPLLGKTIAALMRVVAEEGKKVFLATNGTRLSDAAVRQSVLQYAANITVSVDAAAQETLDVVRPGADLRAIREGVKSLVRERGRRRHPFVGINFVAYEENLGEVEALGGLALETGVDFVTVVGAENWLLEGDPSYENAATASRRVRGRIAEISASVRRLRRHVRYHPVAVFTKNLDGQEHLGRCFWPFNGTYIAVSGQVSPCCLRMGCACSLGNIFSTCAFDDIWYSRAYEDVRRAHESHDRTNKLCGKCPY